MVIYFISELINIREAIVTYLYNAPGNYDNLNSELLIFWNDSIKETYSRVIENNKESFERSSFSITPFENLEVKQILIEWNAASRILETCIGSENARLLSDKYNEKSYFQSEYCEYRIITKQDKNGMKRPKRIHVTTEFGDYWKVIAMHDPIMLKKITEEIIGFDCTWAQLYDSDDPMRLNINERKNYFEKGITGYMTKSGDWLPPSSLGLNNRFALCMTNKINKLYDLMYTFILGSIGYFDFYENEKQQLKNIRQIFLGDNQKIPKNLISLYSRADPSIINILQNNVFDGKKVAMSNPIGVYILSFNDHLFFLNNESLPKNWIKLSRGNNTIDKISSTYQHLEFGPPDDEDYFLDDITIALGDKMHKITGGYQILEQIEVGTLIEISQTEKKDNSYQFKKQNDTLLCRDIEECKEIKDVLEVVKSKSL